LPTASHQLNNSQGAAISPALLKLQSRGGSSGSYRKSLLVEDSTAAMKRSKKEETRALSPQPRKTPAGSKRRTAAAVNSKDLDSIPVVASSGLNLLGSEPKNLKLSQFSSKKSK